MSQLTKPLPVLKFSSFLFNTNYFSSQKLIDIWQERFGEGMFLQHSYFPMKKYYSKEMGMETDLQRFFLFSLAPTDRIDLIEDKLWADHLEQKFLNSNNRTVNIDPGYVSLENVILSTGKNYSHRIFLGQGVFAELTLIFKQPSFIVTNWTYPDYSDPQLIEFFNWIRQFLFTKVNSRKA